MKKYTVTFIPDKNTVSVPEGTSLLFAAKQAGINISGTCGGRGTCGKCAVRIIEVESNKISVQESANMVDESGKVHDLECTKTDKEKYANLSKEESADSSLLKSQQVVKQELILSCQHKVSRDIVIEVPLFSRLTEHKIELFEKANQQICVDSYFAMNSKNPLSRRIWLTLDIPDLSDSTNDLDRLRAVLLKDYDIHDARIGLNCLRKLPKVLRASNWKIWITVVTIRDIVHIVEIEPENSRKSVYCLNLPKPAYGMAVDVGTTTVVVNLVNLDNGSIVGCEGTYNKQAVYGSDVISRIVFAEDNPDGLKFLQEAILESINTLVVDLCKKNSICTNDICVMVCAGNTVMTHFLLRMPGDFLRREPYVPVCTKFPEVFAKEIGISINPDGIIVFMPSVSSYVGGDIVSGVLATMLNKSEKITLFMDIGTNGELVLGNKEWMVTCSCSAGPAFEGSGISCGMRAMNGAIDLIQIDNNFDTKVRVIGDNKPIGICGSGLIYAIAEMMRAGIINRAGKIHENEHNMRIRRDDNGILYVIVWAKDSGTGMDVVITQNDIKNLLRAKAAMFSGIRTMLDELSLGLNNIEKIYIAGGFGSYINIFDAIKIGLLPDLPVDLYQYVGNTSLQGAFIALLSQEVIQRVEDISSQMTNLELSIGNKFMDEFTQALFIPHTNMDLFPNVIIQNINKISKGEM